MLHQILPNTNANKNKTKLEHFLFIISFCQSFNYQKKTLLPSKVRWVQIQQPQENEKKNSLTLC